MESTREITVVGAGAWGTTIANIIAGKNPGCRLWSYEKDVVDDINIRRTNSKYLNGITLRRGITAFSDVDKALQNACIAILVVPSQFLRSSLKAFYRALPRDAIILSAVKGIEQTTLKRPSQIIEEETGAKEIAVLSGPNLSKEIAIGLPAASVIACANEKKRLILQNALSSEYFRIYTSDDVIGVETGGALKNIIAIAAGICDGLGLGDNAKSALIVRGITEIKRLGVALGAKTETFSGLSGIGDLIATCASPLSRNHYVGVELAKGGKIDNILDKMNGIAEGVKTAVCAKQLAAKYGVEMPITKEVHCILFEGKSPKEAIISLMTRKLKDEE